MKKFILYFITLLLVISACKKGENDPSISFRTRKARLTGVWQIKTGTSRYVEESGTGLAYYETFYYDNNNYMFADNPNYYYVGGHTLTMKFEKDGKITFTEVFDGISTSYYGNWDFNNGIGEKKKKEQVIIHFTSKTNYQGTFKYKGNLTDITYDISELRNDKMKLLAKYKTENPDGSSVYYEDIYEMKQE